MSSAIPDTGFEIARDASWTTTWKRRCLSLPLVLIATAIALLGAPLWLPLAAGIDLFRRPRTALRCGLMLTHYLCCESLGLLASGGIWLASLGGLSRAGRERCKRWSFALQNLWATALFHGATRLFGFRLEMDGGDALSRAPLLLFMRHASLADTLLPAVLITRPHRIRMRYVMKRELLWDPCLDVVGHRLPNYFTRRNSEDSDRERRGVAALASGLGRRDGVLIYPEGTRFSPAKREHVLARLRRGGHSELASQAEALQNVLPPRLGGPLALLDASPNTDVVFGAHAGFEGAGSAGDIWNGALLGAVIRVRFWRIAAADIPAGREARADWLYARWAEVDRAVGRMQEESVGRMQEENAA